MLLIAWFGSAIAAQYSFPIPCYRPCVVACSYMCFRGKYIWPEGRLFLALIASASPRRFLVGRHAGKGIRIVVLVSGESTTSIIQNMIVPHLMVFQSLSGLMDIVVFAHCIATLPSKRPVKNFHSADSFACPAHRVDGLFSFQGSQCCFINYGRTRVYCAESTLWSVKCWKSDPSLDIDLFCQI